jgi:hypothetical protein
MDHPPGDLAAIGDENLCYLSVHQLPGPFSRLAGAVLSMRKKIVSRAGRI